mmetsp:Transcript_5232/g.7345  ORF Transcript_5232/g.7345 Transcript_5232/m.7345 type:complete len:355 (+) Transcript_5232:137-1201(+)
MSSTSISSRPCSSINTVHETKFVIIYVPIIVPVQQPTSNGGINIDDVLKMNASVLKSPLVKNQIINALNQADGTPSSGPNKYGFELYSDREEPKGCNASLEVDSSVDGAEGINLSNDSGPTAESTKLCVKRGFMESSTPSSLETQYCSYPSYTARSLVQQQRVLQPPLQQLSVLSSSSSSHDTKYYFDSASDLPQPCVPGGSRVLISSSSNQWVSCSWVNWNHRVWNSNNCSVQPWRVRECFEGGFEYRSFSALQYHHQRSLQPCEMRTSEISQPCFGHRQCRERLSGCMHRDTTTEMGNGSLEGRSHNGTVLVQKFSKVMPYENKWYFANRVCKPRAKAVHAKAVEAAAALAA